MKLAGIEASQGGLADQPNKELRLRSVLHRLSRTDPSVLEPDEMFEPGSQSTRYDVCVIDCPPSIGLLSYNAIAAGREVIIPVETSFFSLRGAAKQVQTTRSIARRIGMRIHPRLLATMHDPSQPLARDLLDDLRDRFGAGMIPVVVRYDHALKEAASFGQPIDEYAPDSMGAEDYRSVCEWLIEHVNIERPEPNDELDSIRSPLMAGSMSSQAPTLASASVVTQQVDGLSRAQELAMRARSMQQASMAEAKGVGVAQREQVATPLKRSMMPHRPIAIELVDHRVVLPQEAAATNMANLRHLFGTRKSSTGALFVQPRCVGKRIEIAGDFNNWKPQLTPMELNETLGVYEAHIKLDKGRYEYKLVIDGQWVIDEYNPQRIENGFGSTNNLVVMD